MSDNCPEYPKISGPFKRSTEGPDRNKLIVGKWARPEFEDLAHASWHFTEKIDGMNMRVYWDGHKPQFFGRSDRAQIPGDLMDRMEYLFTEELLEAQFEGTPVILYGEGYGAGIQKAGVNYSGLKDFILFDVLIDGPGGVWLTRESVEEIGAGLNISVAPLILGDTLWGGISLVAAGLDSTFGSFTAEGLVGVPQMQYRDRRGGRIAIKLKGCDLEGVDLHGR